LNLLIVLLNYNYKNLIKFNFIFIPIDINF